MYLEVSNLGVQVSYFAVVDRQFSSLGSGQECLRQKSIFLGGLFCTVPTKVRSYSMTRDGNKNKKQQNIL